MPTDRAIVEDYLDSVREIERRMRAAEAPAICRAWTLPGFRLRCRTSTRACG